MARYTIRNRDNVKVPITISLPKRIVEEMRAQAEREEVPVSWVFERYLTIPEARE